MCRLCNPAKPDRPCPTRRDFLKTTAIAGAATGAGLGLPRAARAQEAAATLPEGLGQPGRRAVIRGGTILTMDDGVGNFATGDVLLDGPRIAEVGASIDAGDAEVIEADGMIVMPGFVDTHHHQFETALRSALPNGILVNDGRPANAAELLRHDPAAVLDGLPARGRLHQRAFRRHRAARRGRDDGDGRQPDPSFARSIPTPRSRGCEMPAAAPCSATSRAGATARSTRSDARRIREQWFSSDDQLTTMVMGGEIYIPGYEAAWALGPRAGPAHRAARRRHVRDAARPSTRSARAGMFGPDNIFIHMTGMSDDGLAIRGRRRRPCLARRPDRDAHAPRHPADPEGARPRHGRVAVVRRRVHDDGGLRSPRCAG